MGVRGGLHAHSQMRKFSTPGMTFATSSRTVQLYSNSMQYPQMRNNDIDMNVMTPDGQLFDDYGVRYGTVCTVPVSTGVRD